MSMQIPDYAAFAQMPAAARKQSLQVIQRFAGQHATSLFLQVYQFDPDPDIRELARSELARQGITPPTDPTPIEVTPTANTANFGGAFPQASSSQVFTSVTVNGQPVTADTLSDTSAIDGGTGRPVQRGPNLANVFTLFRIHKRYLTGEVDHLPHRIWGYLLLAAILVGVFAIMFVSFKAVGSLPMGDFSLDSVLWLVGGIFVLILLGTYGFWLWNIRRNRRYVRDGTLLLGRVLNASGRWHSSTDSDGSTSRSFMVTVHYRVRLPDGATFDSNAQHSRGDLARGGIPHPGDPVAVLVIDREHMRLL